MKKTFHKVYEGYCETHIKPKTKKIESTKRQSYDMRIIDIRLLSGFYQ